MGAKGSRARKYTEESLDGQVQTCNPLFRQALVANRGLLSMKLKVPIYDSYSLSLVYSPGVGYSCLEIQDRFDDAYLYTNIGNSMAIITDGSDYKHSKSDKFNLDSCIPQLEAQSVFYKVHTNIDAYPYIFNPKLTQTDEEFIECLQGLAGSVSAVELYNIEEERLKTLVPKIQEANLRLAVLTSTERSYIQEIIIENGLSKIFPDGFITASIFRAALDCRVRGLISKELIDSLFSHVKQAYQDKKIDFTQLWDSTQQLNTLAVKFFFSKKLQNVEQTEQQVINRFNNYLLEGKSAWMNKEQKNLETNSLKENSLELHKRFQGMCKTTCKLKPKSVQRFYDLARECCYEGLEDEIIETPSMVRELTFKSNWCAIITNGTAILGFGDIGATAGLPVMEGKSCIFKQLGGVDVVPICIQEKDPKKFISIVERIAPIYAGINLEDIKAPQCFEVENTLKERLDIPVFHDDQHGTAIVTVAAVLNSLKLMGKKAEEVKLVVNGGGAAGISITQLLLDIGIKDIVICDTKGAIFRGRTYNMNPVKEQLAQLTNINNVEGNLDKIIEGADIFVGVSAAGALTTEMASKMTEKNLVLAMANPIPEIMPEEAKKAGVFIYGTGRSDFKNQVNNSLAFPGIFRGTLDVQAVQITQEMKLAAATAIAQLIPDYEVSPDYVIPSSLDTRVPIAVAKAVGLKAIEQGVARKTLTAQQLEENMRNFIVERRLLNLK